MLNLPSTVRMNPFINGPETMCDGEQAAIKSAGRARHGAAETKTSADLRDLHTDQSRTGAVLPVARIALPKLVFCRNR